MLGTVRCNAPRKGTNTNPIPGELKDGLVFPQSYTYSCLDGYTTVDAVFTQCQADGELSLTTPPTCVGRF